MRLFIGFLLLALVALQYKLWVGDASVKEWFNLEKKVSIQEEQNKKLELRNHALEADIDELKSGDQALEEAARYNLGMVKDGEVYYHVVE